MTIEEIKALLSAAYQEKKIMLPLNEVCDRPLRNGYRHYIYSYAALPELIKELKRIPARQSDDEDDTRDRLAVRYTVDDEGKIWFAKEGRPSMSIPDHARIRSHCYSAGNIYFSEDYESITHITNKSGHFQPSPGTLVWAIAALLSLKACFSETITIVMHTSSDSKVLPSETALSADALLSLLPDGPFPDSNNDFWIEVHTHNNFELHDKPIKPASAVARTQSFHAFWGASESEKSDDEEAPIKRSKPTVESASTASPYLTP